MALYNTEIDTFFGYFLFLVNCKQKQQPDMSNSWSDLKKNTAVLQSINL